MIIVTSFFLISHIPNTDPPVYASR